MSWNMDIGVSEELLFSILPWWWSVFLLNTSAISPVACHKRWEKIRIFSLPKTALLKFSLIANCISAYRNCVSNHRNTWWSASFLSPYSHNHSPFPNQPGREQGGSDSLWWKGRTLPLLPNLMDKTRLSEYPAQAVSLQTDKASEYSQRTHAPAQSQSVFLKHTSDLVQTI